MTEKKDELIKINQLAVKISKTPIKMEASKRIDHEHDIEKWLEKQGIENEWELAPPLVNLGYDLNELALLAEIPSNLSCS